MHFSFFIKGPNRGEGEKKKLLCLLLKLNRLERKPS